MPIKLGKKTVNVSKTLLESDFRISLALLKRDKKATLLGAIPNLVISSVLEHDRPDFYKSRTFHRDTVELLKLLRPSLSVIDGFDAVKKVKLKSALAIASTDGAAADTTAAKILKIKPRYLSYCKKGKINIRK